MKRKYKKTKKGHARRNATIKRKKRTRRQRGGAKVILQNMDVSDDFARNGQEYTVIRAEYDDHDSPQHVFVGKARASIMHQTCGAAFGPLVGRGGEPRCDIISYHANGPGILASYNPNRTIRSTYEGNFVDGKKQRHGKLTYSDGTVYDGNWENDARSGFGKLTQPPVKKNKHGETGYPAIYEGHWANNLKSGLGTKMYHDGSVYTGEWDNDAINGKGKMQYSDGDVYEGDFVNEQKHGHGKHTFHTHPVFQEYEGDFENGMMQGHGTMVMKNRDSYVGEVQDGEMHGKGTMIFHDKTRYEGDWDQGRMHGRHGQFYDATGKMIYNGPVADNGPVEEEEEEEEEEEAPAPALFENPGNIFQNPQQNTGNIFRNP